MRIIAESHIRGNDTRLGLPLGIHREIRDIAGMRPVRVLQPMLFPVRIKVRARSLEIRSFALCILMDVDSVLSRRQSVQIQADLDALRRLGKYSGANTLALPILKIDGDCLRALTVLGDDRGVKKYCYGGQEQ